MPKHKFADLHCHPVMRPMYNKTGHPWEGYCYNKEFQQNYKKNKTFRKVLEAQLLSDRGAMYDQASYSKLLNGNVRLVFAALYPLEKGFMLKKDYDYQDPRDITEPVRIISESRDFTLSLFTKYPKDSLEEMIREEYWTQLGKEYGYYFAHSTNNKQANANVKEGSQREIAFLIDDQRVGLSDKKARELFESQHHVKIKHNIATGIEGQQFQSSGRYTIADGSNPPPNVDGYDGNTIHTVFTIEGMGVITQTRSDRSWYPLALHTEEEIMRRLKVIKERSPIFFITFCHHFKNGVCGHARSFIRIAKLLKLDQSEFLDEGFTPLGMKILMKLLSIKKDGAGGYEDNRDEDGRRVFIDMKHMSFNGRSTLIHIVSKYNKHHPGHKIPLISSHTGYSGYSEIEMRKRIKDDDLDTDDKNQELGLTQTRFEEFPSLDFEMRYNSWSINLADEEVAAIVESEGLIGLSFEQNILGIAFIGGKKGFKIKKGKKQIETQELIRQQYLKLIVGQLCKMAQVTGTGKFWKHVCIGTDYDGLINPVDGFSSVLFFDLVREGLIDLFNGLPAGVRKDFFIPGNANDVEALVDDFCFNNAARFLKTHFDQNNMPDAADFLNEFPSLFNQT